jgi:hypothetical protein
MSERLRPGPISGSHPPFRAAACIQTNKVYDSCREKQCLEDLRLYLFCCDPRLIERATSVKCRSAEVIWVVTDVEEVPFNRGFFTVDVRYYFKVTIDIYPTFGPPTQCSGLAIFDKRVILFGSEGKAKIFASKYVEDEFDPQLGRKNNLPKAVVEVVDPICLGAKIVDVIECNDDDDLDLESLPECVCRCFEGEMISCHLARRVFVTLGLFSIVKLVRKVQLLIPEFDFCIPERECVGPTQEEPCELFERINFPIDEFFPPQEIEEAEDIGRCCR